MYTITESELIFVIDLIKETITSGEINTELEEAEDLLQSILSNPQVEAV